MVTIKDKTQNENIFTYIIKLTNTLILEATDRQPMLPTAVVPAYFAIAAAQDAEPGIVGNELRRTPPATVDSNEAECTIIATETTRKTCKAACVSAIAIIFPPAGVFHFFAGNCFSS